MTTPMLNLNSRLFRCRLGAQELAALFTVASQGFQPGEIEFSHERHNRTFTARTLADLISAVQAAPLPGDPDRYDNLAFTATDPAGRRTVAMRLTPQAVATRITGTDATLVYGTDSQIRLFLTDEAIGGQASSNARAKGFFERQVASNMGLLLLSTLVVGTAIKNADDSQQVLDAARTPATAMMWIFVAVNICLFGHDAVVARVTRGVLAPTRTLPSGNFWERLNSGERIAYAGVLVAILAATGTLISAGADVLK
ncbi:hypothetical protein [Streptomyces sp. gb14]|uniref:hypothetical protein n=1 Tax=Streptomyces sp. gb14 TaxID=1827753 RepID=UPI000BF0F663|nr:hypothetical protein [Streptomyces sp. gb14]